MRTVGASPLAGPERLKLCGLIAGCGRGPGDFTLGAFSLEFCGLYVGAAT